MQSLALIVPLLDEEKALPALIEVIGRLDPQPTQVIAVDGGSSDRTCELVRQAGWTLVETARGRGRQINEGVRAASSTLACVLHADTTPPIDMVEVIRDTLEDDRIALASFTPLITGEKTRWFTSAHNFIKTWYAPLITRPHLFFRGVRLLFGDHAMFFRRADFLAIGGCTPGDAVMEEADLCVKFAALGRIKMVRRVVRTSDRRIAAWGPLKANWIYFKVGMMWAFGLRSRMEKNYPDIR
ncbi:glycosyltransferase [Parerythrobacter jejuensis]|uniref:Glycosyltransferase n=1 Tax=Parerythrobacter jejuensis TaxID=795812 RepID=A0A845ASG5_9SPHN|nr:glycosyltransferase [Parerythrobacter jejuensis]MXP31446.1 glycosyltransferase [Parerythrobacter jejuensis]